MTTTNGQTNGSGAIVVSAKDKRHNITKALEGSKASWGPLLPKHIKTDQLLRSATAAVAKTPELLACSPQSIVLAVAQAAALGLLPNTPLGLGYLVPFKTTCTFVPGYRGLVRLAIQSGEVKSIESRAVYSKDAFEVHMGTDPRIDHSPSLDADRGDMVGVYAVARLLTGEAVFEWMSIGEVNAIRDRSKAKGEGPWVTDYTEMARKTVVRRLCKMLPLSEEKLGRALELQAAAEAGVVDHGAILDAVGEVVDEDTGEVLAEAQAEPQGRTDAARDRLTAKAGGA